MGKTLKTAFSGLVSEVERKQSKRLIKQLHTLVECHADSITSTGIDAIQAIKIAAVLAGGGRVHAFGDGFVEVQNGMGEVLTFHRGDDTHWSNLASDAGPGGDSAASQHGGQARVWISPKCPPPMRQLLKEVFGNVDAGSTDQHAATE